MASFKTPHYIDLFPNDFLACFDAISSESSGLINLKVTDLIFQLYSLLDGENRSLFCRPYLLHLSVLVASLEGENLLCGNGRQLCIGFVILLESNESTSD